MKSFYSKNSAKFDYLFIAIMAVLVSMFLFSCVTSKSVSVKRTAGIQVIHERTIYEKTSYKNDTIAPPANPEITPIH